MFVVVFIFSFLKSVCSSGGAEKSLFSPHIHTTHQKRYVCKEKKLLLWWGEIKK